MVSLANVSWLRNYLEDSDHTIDRFPTWYFHTSLCVQVIQQIEATLLQADPDATEIKFMVGALLGSLPFSSYHTQLL